MDSLLADVRVSSPGIIQSFDSAKGTVEVQLSVKEQRRDSDGKLHWEQVPLLVDVPLFVLSGGNFSITSPVKKNDECLVIFGDTGMDWWWQNGGVQQALGTRRHDLSDGFALVGFRSLPNSVSNYSTNSLQIRNKDKSVLIELTTTEVNIKGGTVNVSGSTVKIGSSTTIDNKVFLRHIHSGVRRGVGVTGPVV